MKCYLKKIIEGGRLTIATYMLSIGLNLKKTILKESPEYQKNM